MEQNKGKYILGDKQLAQAFLWQATNFSKPNSIICLIVSAKGFLFNISDTSKIFRKQFFEENYVRTILNFSAMSNDLFENAKAPAVAVIYSPGYNEAKTDISYITPKPSIATKKLDTIIIDNSDIKQIPRDISYEDEAIWKSAMWGNPRDWDLITRLKKNRTLDDYIGIFDWEKGEGFKLHGKDEKPYLWMMQYDYLPFSDLKKYYIPKTLDRCKWDSFHRPRIKEIYTAPLCLLKRNPKKGEFFAAFSMKDVCYKDAIMGIAGEPENAWALKILVCYINSRIVRYFLFLTCSRWGIERTDILVEEYLKIPLIIPDKDNPTTNTILNLYEKLVELAPDKENNPDKWNLLTKEVDKFFFNLYNLTNIDEAIIEDTINYSQDYISRRKSAPKYAEVKDLEGYASSFRNTIETMIGKQISLRYRIYVDSKNLYIVQFSFGEKKESGIKSNEIKLELDPLLSKLTNIMKETISKNVQFKRLVKIYDGDTIYVIKPPEIRYWTISQAYKDADDTIADSLELRGEDY